MNLVHPSVPQGLRRSCDAMLDFRTSDWAAMWFELFDWYYMILLPSSLLKIQGGRCSDAMAAMVLAEPPSAKLFHRDVSCQRHRPCDWSKSMVFFSARFWICYKDLLREEQLLRKMHGVYQWSDCNPGGSISGLHRRREIRRSGVAISALRTRCFQSSSAALCWADLLDAWASERLREVSLGKCGGR